MENEILKKNKAILKEYNDIKDSIKNNKELKYEWYLKLKDILSTYLRVNNNWYKSAEDFRRFPITFYTSSFNYTEEEAKEIINKIADFLFSLFNLPYINVFTSI